MTETHLYTGMRGSISMSQDPSYAHDRIPESDALAETQFAVVEKQEHSDQGVIRSEMAEELDNLGQGETNYEEIVLLENDGRWAAHTKSDINVYNFVVN
ncbi:hypothetical protein DPMN_014489 [Dreissena polymorpha]|uniref:Uncharacterized protein n=1 Tax=Dreissena polymorpha TaxID=45954 RepID=A0A9D4N9G6_DREPO|nr:hypothetical protein DPMN_014489 [Dreissena polymorpha]